MLQLMGPSGIADLVTAESDPEDWLWKTVRKGVAPAFAAQALRAVYPKLAGVGSQLVQALLCKGEDQAVDMSLACMCETIDALGLTGFNKVFHNVEAFKNGDPAEMLTVSTQPSSASNNVPVVLFGAAVLLTVLRRVPVFKNS